ncbi:hypothetical protein [Simkania sp.]|uniref:hypothetical protein n=1 Tax=Simkania sp. TaxID=34094 RepID=UPI003B517C51
MKGFFKAVFLSGALLSAPMFADTTPEEKQGHELCLFAQDVFNALGSVKEQKQISSYESSQDPVIQNLAEKFIASFQEDASPEDLQTAVSELGRLLKCSADEDYRLPYALHRKELQEKTALMEKALKGSLPENPNYHKLMIESLADQKWDVALYAYLKIAEERCTD